MRSGYCNSVFYKYAGTLFKMDGGILQREPSSTLAVAYQNKAKGRVYITIIRGYHQADIIEFPFFNICAI